MGAAGLYQASVFPYLTETIVLFWILTKEITHRSSMLKHNELFSIFRLTVSLIHDVLAENEQLLGLSNKKFHQPPREPLSHYLVKLHLILRGYWSSML